MNQESTMSHHQVILAKLLRNTLTLCCGLWFVGFATAEQSEAQAASGSGLTVDEEYALIQACNQDAADTNRALKSRCEAWQTRLAAIKESTLNRWIELESKHAHQRVYVAVPQQTAPFSSTSRRIHLRYDTDPTSVGTDPAMQRTYPPTVVRTLDLNCMQGETTMVAMSVYDKDGNEFSKGIEKPKAGRILSFYDSPLRLVCSGEYLLPYIPNGEKLTEAMKAERTTKQKTAVPDRIVAVPK